MLAFLIFSKMITFKGSYFTLSDLPSDGKTEVGFIGRSNVGKSSLINALAQRKDIAKVSSTPGKTQSFNYYDVDGEFYLVDMPGYGFAKRSYEKREEWTSMFEEYFDERSELKLVCVLIDSRHSELENDTMLLDWLEQSEKRWVIVLTKIDKLSQKEIAAHKNLLATKYTQCLGVIPVSSKSGIGIKMLRSQLKMLIS
jgi:GTP-binding protein